MSLTCVRNICVACLSLAFMIPACADNTKKKKGSAINTNCNKPNASTTPTAVASGTPAATPIASVTASPAGAALYDDEGFELAGDVVTPTFDEVKVILKREATACKATLDCGNYDVVKTNIVDIMNSLPVTLVGADFKKINLWLAAGMPGTSTSPSTTTTPSPATTGSPSASGSSANAQGNCY